MTNVTWIIDGTIAFNDNRAKWPRNDDGHVWECIYLTHLVNVTFTSNGKGTFDGRGREWWGAARYLDIAENRPRIMHIKYSSNILVENLLFKDSPYWTFWAEYSDGLVIRYSDVDARITEADKHTLLDLSAFNTDGFDVTGKNVHIHDCNIWNQDDCVAVKDHSENMLIERVFCSGLGLVIGSIGNSTVRNITFRDSIMHKTVKGIYMKTRWYDNATKDGNASITEIYYHNITINEP